MPAPLRPFLFAALCASVYAQSGSLVNPTTAGPTASPLVEAHGYAHIGCWNETTGFAGDEGGRALESGKTSANNTMTASDCLEYCAEGNSGYTMQYAALEYGRECYCGASLNDMSEQINDSLCKYACNGNESQICGGQLALTLYNLTDSGESQEGAAAWGRIGGAAGYGFVAAGLLVGALIL